MSSSCLPSAPVDELICAALRGEKPSWPLPEDSKTVALFLDRCTHHGVQVLLHARAAGLRWPPAALAALRQQAMAWALWEEHHRHMLEAALEALASRNVRPVVFKGSALAYSVYPEPYLRPRADTDLLIAAKDRWQAAAALESLGFARSGTVDCEYISYESGFTRREAGLTQMIDLHWRIHYSQMQAHRFPYQTLRDQARPLPRLSRNAMGASPVHAVLLNCVHRANDMRVPQWSGGQASFGADRLIWIYDVHLLVEQMTPRELEDLARTALAAGVRTLVKDPIALAVRHFNTRLPDSLLRSLDAPGESDSVARYQSQSALRQRWADFSAVDGVGAKAAYLLEHIVPPPAYMRDRYPGCDQTPMARLRARRLLEGLRRWRSLAKT